MGLKKNAILITGGSSGIGLQLAKILCANNKILICGRSSDKLEKVKKELQNIEIFQCDLSQKMECKKLAVWVKANHSECNVLINNAAIVHSFNFQEEKQAVIKGEKEIAVNFMAPILLSKLFIPILGRNANPKLINISTGLVYAPRAVYPFYNATKAALHSFTQVIRIQMKASPISIIEVLFPAVDTPWHKGKPPEIAISAEQAVSEMVAKIEKGHEEIKVGKVKLLFFLSRVMPAFALRKINGMKNN